MNSFAELGVRPFTLERLLRLKITDPTEVQTATIPLLEAGRDCVIQSPTGSGKTLAFLIPMVERLRGHRRSEPRALIVTPTRELAAQIGAVLTQLDPGLHRALVFGGVGYGGQISSLRTADVIIGCPGRLVDLSDRGAANLSGVEFLVLDEADEMLDAGFAKDVEKLVARTRQPALGLARQTVLASATMPAWVTEMARKHMHEPTRVAVAPPAESQLEHGLFSVSRAQKVTTLSHLLRRSESTIVFHRTKHGTKRLARDLAALGHKTSELQGNLSQAARDRAILAFRRRETAVLVATNVAARGIDVVDVDLVVNYELPDTAEWLTHRVGRTARNGASGRALTFLSEDDGEKWRKLRKLGAPALQFVDSAELLRAGTMTFLAHQPEQAIAGGGSQRPGPGGRLSRGVPVAPRNRRHRGR
ncbi:MAG TPA: DEAD/DEAH box helicase [Candidatus Dormibacteraeota bacterium]